MNHFKDVKTNDEDILFAFKRRVVAADTCTTFDIECVIAIGVQINTACGLLLAKGSKTWY